MKNGIVCLVFFLLGAMLLQAGGAAEKENAFTILKIGTPNVVKSANVFGDYYLGIFAHISNPPLMKMNLNGTLTGQTAEKVEVSDDSKTWSFTIRDDLYWSDGKKLTAEDVLFSIEYTGKHNPNAAWIANTLEKAEVIEKNKVRLTFTKPYTRLRLEFSTYNIFPKHIYEDIDDPMQQLNPGENVGFGPFVISSIDLDAGQIRFDRNEFWQGEKPEIDGFEIHIYKNIDVLSLALEKGDIDTYYKYASSYPYPNIKRLEETGRFNFTKTLNMGLVFLAFNTRKGPAVDLDLRRALSYAIGYEEVLKLDALGYGEIPNRGFVPPSMGGYTETPTLIRDKQKALELLYQAGFTDTDGDDFVEDQDGNDLELSILVREDWNRIGELLVDYFEQIGVKSSMRSLDVNGWVSAKDSYDYDVTVTRSTPWGMLMHANWGTGYFDSRRTGRGVLHNVDDPDFLALCDTILATTAQIEVRNLGGEVQKYYADNVPATALYWNEIITPFNRKYTGWKPDPLFGIYNIDTLLSVTRE